MESSSYKDKLLNLFGEEVSQKLQADHEQKMNNLSSTVGTELQQESQVLDIGDGAGIEIPLYDEEWKKWSLPWEKTLIVNMMGKKINFKSLENNLQRKWPKKGKINIVDMADGFFLVFFSSKEDYSYALFEGPWMIVDNYLIVQKWRPMFLQSVESVRKVAVWIRIPKLPFELYNTNFLWRIESGLGTMLKVDRLTSIHSRGQYARICVEIDLDKPLKSYIMI